jgi:cobalt/nickel transport system ATP-binding protein
LNLGKSEEEAEQVAMAALEKVRMEGFGDRVTYRMSFGEKKLVALAAVLAMEPRVLLLDEPMAGLDEDHAQGLVDILRDLPQAMILVSHDPRLLDAVATRRVRLTEGRIAEMP